MPPSQAAMQSREDQVLHPADEPDRLPLPPPLLHLPHLHRPRGLQRHRQGGQDYPPDQGADKRANLQNNHTTTTIERKIVFPSCHISKW